MSAVSYRFIEPLDVLFLRGNKLFGEPGSYGETVLPPWPSVAAGAIRSRMLVDRQINLTAFAAGDVTDDPELGTPARPGTFMLAGFYLARRNDEGRVEILMPPPADLVISHSDSGLPQARLVRPQTVELASSCPLPLLPVLAQGRKREKPVAGYWLTQAGWSAWLRGDVPASEHLVPSSALWRTDERIGIGMNSTTRSVDAGKLVLTQALVMRKRGEFGDEPHGQRSTDYDVGFLAVVSGAQAPSDGVLRFGGDGRAAAIMPADVAFPHPDYEAIAAMGRCRLVLNSPALFPSGWMLPGADPTGRVDLGEGVSARVVAATVPRSERLSGWDLAKKRPKALQRAVPTGSVYWLDELQGSPQALRKLVENGLWSRLDDNGQHYEYVMRRAEGFNRIAVAVWP
ncbi:type III-B CRISPR module-associated Cmr3 family protein [Yanghanlia caeni]|uniref:Type III-B CRISPR module-associated Cmr3 family protein n=1 Tax=Yanghanlia caeni TaxID=3064283 RepID=A0ABU1D2D6_9BURK|nr:type III-B CRISPR module-associated Cmr3 family protein [Alcaligenaceae bacterium LG-2]